MYFHCVYWLIDASHRNGDGPGPVEKCIHAARWLPLSVNPFVNLTAVVQTGIEKDTGGKEL